MFLAAPRSFVAAREPKHAFNKPALSCPRFAVSQLLLTVLLLFSILSAASAYEMRAQDVSDTRYYQYLKQRGKIMSDGGIPPSVRDVQMLKRVVSAVSSTASSSGTATSMTASMTTSASSSTSSDSSAAITTASGTATSSGNNTVTSTSVTSTSSTVPTFAPSDIPQPFDTSLGNNFTSTACPNYFNSFLNNATFQSCLPVSMLLQNSMSFFRAVKNPALLDATLNQACDASLALCSPLMAHIANELISMSICGNDLQRQNPLVLQAHAALIAYEPVYQATCLKDQSTNNYCFAEALSNQTDADDSYPYYIAVGLPLPATAQPNCTPCLQQTMQIFAGYAVQKNQPLATTYLNCAIQIDQTCGSTFANVAVKAGSVGDSTSAAPGRISGTSSWATLGLAATLVVILQAFI